MLQFNEELYYQLKARARLNPNTHCWEWQGYCRGGSKQAGYGVFYKDGGRYLAHRIMAVLRLNLLLEDRNTLVLHQCDNPSCINPEHLRLGDAKDNAREREQRCRGRHSKPTAELLWPKQKGHYKRQRKRVEATTCIKGHELTPDNIYIRTRWGYVFKECRACHRIRSNRYWERKRTKCA